MTSILSGRRWPLRLAALSLCGFAAAAQATLTVYTSEAAFAAAVANRGVDSFNDLVLGDGAASYARIAGSHAYTLSVNSVGGSPSSTFIVGTAADAWVSTNTANDTLRLAGFSSTVRAIGGRFFGTGLDGTFLAGQSILLTATDATGSLSQTLVNTTASGFAGFVSDTTLLSLTVRTAAGFAAWPTLNDISLASAVPEPSSAALWLAALLGGGAAWRRRRHGAGMS